MRRARVRAPLRIAVVVALCALSEAGAALAGTITMSDLGVLPH